MYRLLLSAAVLLVMSNAGSADNGIYAIKVAPSSAQVKAAANQTFYLAPELAAAEKADAEVIGQTVQGEVVLRTSKPAELLALDSIKSTEKVDPSVSKVDKVQLLIGFQEGRRQAVVDALKKAGFQVVKVSERARYVVVEGEKQAKGAISARMVKSLSTEINKSGARSATPNFKVTVPEPNQPLRLRRQAAPNDTIPNDEFFSELWGLRNINAPQAWDVVTESPVIVAIIDTGTQHEHPDLRENIWTNQAEANGTSGEDDDDNGFVDDVHGWDFFNDDNSVFDDPSNDDHGTHVAGTIGAVTDEFGVVGVNWRVQIMPIKFLGPGGGSLDDAVDSIYYAIDNGAKILNNSWGGGGFSPVLENAIRDANDAQILFVAAAGNSGTDNDVDPHFPSSYDVPNVIAVASIDDPPAPDGEELSSFSCFGATSVDVAAPGGNILSTIPVDDFAFFSGTSMATPHVSGALALMRGCEACEDLGHLELRKKLLNEARRVEALSGLCVTGATLDIGFLNGDGSGGGNGAQSSVIIASTTFPPGAVSLTGDGGVIARVEIQLPAAAEVVVTANSSAKANADDVLMDTGLFAESAPTAWSEAVRFVNLPHADTWTSVSISHGTELPKGTHVVEWIGSLNGGDVQLDGGSLSVVANVEATSQSTAGGRATTTSVEQNVYTVESTSPTRTQDVRRREQDLRRLSPSVNQGRDARRARILDTKGRLERMPKVRSGGESE